MDIRNRSGEGSTSTVGIVAIIVLVLIAGYFLFFRGSSAPADEAAVPDTTNVTVPAGAEGGDAVTGGTEVGAEATIPVQ